ncbi:MAG: hypothetical protein HRT35_09670 [Algicola sp.]|nr:hypothetical protein [Algicola sp.]
MKSPVHNIVAKEVEYAGILDAPQNKQDLQFYLSDIATVKLMQQEFTKHTDSSNWRVHMKLLLADLYFNQNLTNIDNCWNWVDKSSTAVPQILLALAHCDKHFDEQVSKRLNSGFYYESRFGVEKKKVNFRAFVVLNCLEVNRVKWHLETPVNLPQQKIVTIQKIVLNWDKSLQHLHLFDRCKHENQVRVNLA